MNRRTFCESSGKEVEIGVSGANVSEMKRFLEKLRNASPFIKIEDKEITPAPGLRIGNIFYHGIPKHKEAEAFAEIVNMIACKGAEEVPAIEQEVEIKIFTTPRCRYCPKAVIAAAKLANRSEKVKLHIYDATEFSALAEKYEVRVVPKIVINNTVFIEAQTTEKKYRELLLNAIEHLKVQTHLSQ